MAPLLEVRDLRVSFETEDGVVQAVDGVSWSIEAGRTLGVVGESGSGKTVGALSLLGLTRSARTRIEGEAIFEGRNLLQLDDEQLRSVRGGSIAMVFQDPLSSLHPFFRVGAQIVEAIQAHQDLPDRAARARAIELLGMVGIPDPPSRIDSWPHEFSGGMRQRAMIAMALANEPKLLIADEPTTALDVTVQAQILDLLDRLRDELGMAMVIVTHDLGVVAETADEVAVMYAGRVVERAATAELFSAPRHPYTWGLLRSIPRLDSPRGSRLTPIAGRPPSLIDAPAGCSFAPRCPYAGDACLEARPPSTPAGSAGHESACVLDLAARAKAWDALSADGDQAEAEAILGVGR
ncbi:MAG: ABC transporter ATP-binding protein [Actinomycetes bacterium]